MLEERRNLDEQFAFLRLPKRWRDAIRMYIASGCNDRLKTKIGVKVGYSPKCANIMVNKLLKKPEVRAVILDAMERKGLTIDKIVDKHKEILFEGKNTFTQRTDHEIQRKTLDMTYKLLDGFPAKKVDVKSAVARYDLTPEDVERLKKAKGENIIDAEIIEEDDVEPI